MAEQNGLYPVDTNLEPSQDDGGEKSVETVQTKKRGATSIALAIAALVIGFLFVCPASLYKGLSGWNMNALALGGAEALTMHGSSFKQRPFVTKEQIATGETIPVMNGREVFKTAVTLMPQAVRDVCGDEGIAVEPETFHAAHRQAALQHIIETRGDGKNIYYSLARPEVRQVIEALHAAFCAPKVR